MYVHLFLQTSKRKPRKSKTHTKNVHISQLKASQFSSPPLTFVPAGSSLLGSFHNPVSHHPPGPPAATGHRPDRNHTQPATSARQLLATNGCNATLLASRNYKKNTNAIQHTCVLGKKTHGFFLSFFFTSRVSIARLFVFVCGRV